MGLHYNYFRDYNSSTGRYIEPDPIDLNGGINLYGYVGGNPLSFNDSSGLLASCSSCHSLPDWLNPDPASPNGGFMRMVAPGNVADTGIESDYGETVSEAKRNCQKPPNQCDWLNENAGKYSSDRVKRQTKKWGCRGSRHSKGGNSR